MKQYPIVVDGHHVFDIIFKNPAFEKLPKKEKKKTIAICRRAAKNVCNEINERIYNESKVDGLRLDWEIYQQSKSRR